MLDTPKTGLDSWPMRRSHFCI